MMKYKNIVVIGGLGFIGYYVSLLAYKKGYKVTILTRSIPDNHDLPEDIVIHKIDVYSSDESGIYELLKCHDILIYAIGADDRSIHSFPSYKFFHYYNVEKTGYICRISKQAGIKRIIILGFYFCYFNRIWPDLKLTKYHPYIKSRVEQEEIAFKTASQGMDMIIVELPYILGVMKNKIPIWKPLIKYVLSFYPIIYMNGGSNMISVEKAAEGIICAVEYGKHGRCYQVGDKNLTWKEFLNLILKFGNKKKNIIIIPYNILKIIGHVLYLIFRLRGKESGLHPGHFMKMQTRNCFFDSESIQKILNFTGGGLEHAIEKTVIDCMNK